MNKPARNGGGIRKGVCRMTEEIINRFKPRTPEETVEEVISRLKAGTPEMDIAAWLMLELDGAEAVFRIAHSLVDLANDPECEYATQCGTVADLMIPSARELPKSEWPV